MRGARLLRALVASAAALAGGLAQAQEPARAIVQQRLPDGSILLTDRPQANATTTRRWDVPAAPPADAASAAERRAKAEADAATVNERFARQLEQQRERDAALEIERQRAAAAAAEREAAQARLREAPAPDVVVGWPVLPPQHVRPPKPPKPFPVPQGFKPYEPPKPQLPVIKPRKPYESAPAQP
ncbi:hypothetical protein [Caldimonas sp. KR1-144]|uniref:hypothetical protein n=1 Tax=Caldimonas sp. KR1-144 TaxID=3400911 RepID=UPI003C05F7AB